MKARRMRFSEVTDYQRAALDRANLAREELQRLVGNTRSCRGLLPCPNCAGQIAFAISEAGHRTLRCGTPDCVNVLE